MYGAFIGDIVGSQYEFDEIKTKDFTLFSYDCDFTDDSVMTVAVASAVIRAYELSKTGETEIPLSRFMTEEMQKYGQKYPHPKGAYGGNFSRWLKAEDPQPYNSFGNGSAMRVSPCGIIAVTLEEAQELAEISAAVSHNHPEGIKGAKAVASAVFLAANGADKNEIRRYIEDNYYTLDFTIDEIRPSYYFNESCQGSVPQAIECFLESTDLEDTVRNVVSIGGDCDTTGAMAGAIAYAYYKRLGGEYKEQAEEFTNVIKQKFLPAEFIEAAEKLNEISVLRRREYIENGKSSRLY